MCGFVALVAPMGDVTTDTVVALQAILRHRGPDSEGVVMFRGGDRDPLILAHADTQRDICSAGLPYSPTHDLASTSLTDVRVVFCHRRLSILDLSPTGHQPMCSADRRLWIIYNGEIYNYLELRTELAALGHCFVSASDTEVLLAGYREWGRDLLHRLNGIFAFIMFDRTTGTLFAARDRFGVKPLYYWISPMGPVAFASEIKAFSVLPDWRPTLNGQSAYDFLNWNVYDHTDETLFGDVFQLRAGQMLELDLAPHESSLHVDRARIPARNWYTFTPQDFTGTLQDATSEWLSLLRDAVRLQLRSDVPVGSCLSGGLDSSLLVSVIRSELDNATRASAQKTFSAYAGSSALDERRFIEAVVRHSGVESYTVDPDPDSLFSRLDSLAWHHDEPFGSSSIFAQWSVFGLAAQNGVKVTLDGQGADELLAGYHTYFGAHLARLLRSCRWSAWWREAAALRSNHGYRLPWSLQQSANFLLPETLRQPLRRWAGRAAEPRDPFLDAGAARAESVRELSRSQIFHTSLPMLLHCEDRDSMAHSVEARVPYLDHRLVEFTVGLPDRFKIGKGTTKRVMREAARDLLPEMVRLRNEKVGFATAEEIWMRQAAPDAFRRTLREAVEASWGIIRHDALGWLEGMICGKLPFDYSIWRMISFGAWLRVFGIGR